MGKTPKEHLSNNGSLRRAMRTMLKAKIALKATYKEHIGSATIIDTTGDVGQVAPKHVTDILELSITAFER